MKIKNLILSYKIRIYPNKKQEGIINRTLGSCRWVYNDFLGKNIERYKNGKKHMNGMEYSKKLTKWKESNPDYIWLNEISQKAINSAFMDCDEAYDRFFKKKGKFPKFKSKKRNPVTGYYFATDRLKFKHNYVNLPILHWTKITENDYIPNIILKKDKEGKKEKYDEFGRRYVGGTIKRDTDGKYYIVVRCEIPFDLLDRRDDSDKNGNEVLVSNGIGIDVGIESYITAYVKDEYTFKFNSFLKHEKIKKYQDKIVKLQRIISNKMEMNYGKLLNDYLDKHNGEEPNEITKNIMKGESYSNTCRRLQKKINSLNKKIHNYKKDKLNKLVLTLARRKPEYITIEDLSVKNLLENNASSELHKYIQDSMFRYFFTKLTEKSAYYGVEVRKADKFFASSKKCSNCGHKNDNLTLKDRIYYCPNCDHTFDRDENAAINLCNLKKYTIINPLWSSTEFIGA